MRLLAVAAAIATGAASCSSDGSAPDGSGPARPRDEARPRASAPVTMAPVPTFDGAVAPIDEVSRARMGASWRPGCPVRLEDLRLLTLDHWGFGGVEQQGELVVHADHAEAVLGVFRSLWEARFPIERMQLVDVFGGDDDASMAANNTSGFNCREVAGRPGAWSQHAYGLAVDVNPLVNPYVLSAGDVRPPAGAVYLDRARETPGLIRAGDVVVSAFAAIGWEWGGAWSSPDYQHFSATGR